MIRTVSYHFEINIVFCLRVCEPRVFQDFLCALLPTTNSIIRLYLQESVDKVGKFIRMRYPDMIGHLVPLFHVLMLYTFGIDTDEHLVHDDADGPPVSCKGKVLAFEKLWSDAAWNSCI